MACGVLYLIRIKKYPKKENKTLKLRYQDKYAPKFYTHDLSINLTFI